MSSVGSSSVGSSYVPSSRVPQQQYLVPYVPSSRVPQQQYLVPLAKDRPTIRESSSRPLNHQAPPPPSREEKHQPPVIQASILPPGEASQLEEIIQKATALSAKILKDKQKSEGINRSYEYYETLPGPWIRVEESTSAYLKEINALIEEKQSFEKQNMELLKEFSRFDSIHHVTCLSGNSQLVSFRKSMKEISRELESYNNLPSLKSKFTAAVPPYVQPGNVVTPKINEEGCCVIL